MQGAGAELEGQPELGLSEVTSRHVERLVMEVEVQKVVSCAVRRGTTLAMAQELAERLPLLPEEEWKEALDLLPRPPCLTARTTSPTKVA